MTQVRKNITLQAGTKRELQRHAFDHDTSRNQLIVEMLSIYASGEPVIGATPPVEAIPVKLAIEPQVWEKAMERAHAEGLSISQVIEMESRRVLAGR